MDDLLPVTNGVVVISGASASDPVLADALKRCAGPEAKVTITSPQRTVSDDLVIVEGFADFINATRLKVHAEAKRRGAHVSLTARFTLIDGKPKQGSWRFSASFPKLPIFTPAQQRAQSGKEAESPSNTLDTLDFWDAAFVLNTDADAVDTTTGASLSPGLNFVATLAPPGAIGLLAEALGKDARLVTSGAIRFPLPSDPSLPTTPPGAIRYPWEFESPPGILLRIGAPFDIKIGASLSLTEGALRLFSPIDADAQTRFPMLPPCFAATAELSIPKIGVRVALVAVGLGGVDHLAFSAIVSGATLKKLEDLADFVGGGGLVAALPDDVQAGLNKLDRLGLQAVSVSFGPGFVPTEVGVAIGLPGIDSKILPGFTLDSLIASFAISNPFDSAQRAISVELGAGVEFLGAPLALTLDFPDVFATAATTGPVNVPLSKLLGEVGLDVSPGAVPDLPIDYFGMQIAKDGSFAVAATLAADPGWTVNLGPTTLTVKDVSCSVIRTVGQPVAGAIAGIVRLGDKAQFQLSYQRPGAFFLEADIPSVSLRDLASEIAGVADLPFPPNFPDLMLHNSSARFDRDTDNAGAIVYDFKLKTTVALGETDGFTLAALLLKSSTGTGFAAGVWTPQWAEGAGWSPGSLWQPLSALSIDSAGLLLSSIAPTDAQRYDILPRSAVPAIAQSKFKVQSGVSFFATLTLKSGPTRVLAQIFGDTTSFSLFASLGGDGSTLLLAHLAVSFDRGAFTFDGLDLTWDATTLSSATISIDAKGRLRIEGESLQYDVSGAVSADATARIALAIQNWVHPFGYQRLIVKSFGAAMALSPAGVTIALEGSFGFTTGQGKAFAFAAAGAITDFEAPTALAFALKTDSPDTSLKISEIIEGITTIDIYNLPKEADALPWVDEIKLLDLFLQITELSFWVVVVDQVDIVGVTYKKGFGFRGAVTLFGKDVRLYVELREAESRFAGSAEIEEELRLGDIFVLGRPVDIAIDSKRDLAVDKGKTPATPKGPALAVSTFIDAAHPQYLFVAAHVALLDLFKVDIYGEASQEGITYSYDLAAGVSGEGAWAKQSVNILASREKLAFSCKLLYEFGLRNVSLGGFELFDVLEIPEISLPYLFLSVTGDIGASLVPADFHLGGTLAFAFLDIDLDQQFAIDLDLSQAPAKLGAFGSLLLDWIKQNLRKALEDALSTAAAFAAWVKAQFEKFKDELQAVANILKDVFGLARDAAFGLLQDIGYALEDISRVIDDVYEFVRKTCAMTQAVLAF